jgi:polyhydroxyalkanoate synthesis regulator phasin
MLRKPVALAAVALAAVAGGGAAYAATSGSDPRDALLNDAAKRLDVSPDDLRSALKGAAADQLDQAVKDGKLTQKQADAMKQHLDRDGGPIPFGGPPPGATFHRFGGPPRPFGAAFGIGLDAAAGYLDLSRAQLRERLAAGDSLADVAKAQGKSVDGLVQALVDSAEAELDKAVAAGDLTAKQRDAIEQDLEQHAKDVVQGKGPLGGPCGPGGPGGHMEFRFRRRGGSGSSTEPGNFTMPAPAGSVEIDLHLTQGARDARGSIRPARNRGLHASAPHRRLASRPHLPR